MFLLTRSSGHCNNVAANYLRDLSISLSGCDGGIGGDSDWHQSISDNNVVRTSTFTVPPTLHQGGYTIYIEGRSRAFEPGAGGLGSDWDHDPLYIWTPLLHHFVILDA